MQIFKQRDYPHVLLGSSNLTIAADGCYTCVLAEINNIFGANCTPDQVAAHKEFYTLDGQIINTKLDLQNTVFDWSGAWDQSKVDEYLSDWQNKQMAVKIQLPRGQTHFMKIDQKNWLGRYQCDDPWSGQKVDIEHYGPIIGVRYFSKREQPVKFNVQPISSDTTEVTHNPNGF